MGEPDEHRGGAAVSEPSDAAPAAADGAPFVETALRQRFFQASGFFPMPIVLLCTRSADGAPNLAPHSLCFPVLGDEGHRLLLVITTESKTAANLARSGRVSINFIEERPELFASLKRLAAPVPTAEKMADCPFRLLESKRSSARDGSAPPPLVAEAEQVFECRLVELEQRDEPLERRFLLEVEAVHLRPRWARALEEGGRGPRLCVGYGFRHASKSWLARPSVMVSGPRLRPRFELEVDEPLDRVCESFRVELGRAECPIVGKIAPGMLVLGVPDAESRLWSPVLELLLEPTARGTRLRGSIGPHPHVWTTFIVLHLLLAICGLAGLTWGISSATIDGRYWPLGIPVVTLMLHAFVAGGAFIGQGLGADQMHRLRSFVDDVLQS